MAIDKAVDSGVLDAGLTSIANKIRSRSGGSSQLAFPNGFVSEIDNIPSGGGDNLPARVDGSITSFADNNITKVTVRAFQECVLLESVSAPAATEIGNYAFSGCCWLSDINIPSATSIKDQAFNSVGAYVEASDLNVLQLPEVINIYPYAFNIAKLKGLIAPKCNYVDSSAFLSTTVDFVTLGGTNVQLRNACFQNCSMSQIVFSDNVYSINAKSFYNCRGCMLYDFSNCTGVPSLANTNAFYNIDANAKIVVPDSLYDTWIGATNWSNYASNIIKKTDYDAL